jgi:hypothetical protein
MEETLHRLFSRVVSLGKFNDREIPFRSSRVRFLDDVISRTASRPRQLSLA